MGVSKVNYNGNTLIDLSNDSVTPETLALGETAHNSNGDIITGTMVQSVGSDDDVYVIPQKFIPQAYPKINLEPSTQFSLAEDGFDEVLQAYESGKKLFVRVNNINYLEKENEFYETLVPLTFYQTSETFEDMHIFRFQWAYLDTVYVLEFRAHTDTDRVYAECEYFSLQSTMGQLTAADMSNSKRLYENYKRGGYSPTIDFFNLKGEEYPSNNLMWECIYDAKDYWLFELPISISSKGVLSIKFSSTKYKDLLERVTANKAVVLSITKSEVTGEEVPQYFAQFVKKEIVDSETGTVNLYFIAKRETDTITFIVAPDRTVTFTTTSNFLTNEEINEIIGITVD